MADSVPEAWLHLRVVLQPASSSSLSTVGELLEVNDRGVVMLIPATETTSPEETEDRTIFYPWSQIRSIEERPPPIRRGR